MSIDYATIHLCNALLNLSYAGMLLALWHRRREPHLMLWAVSLLFVSAAVYGFTFTRNPVVVAVLLTAISVNISLVWAGARAFDGRPPYHWYLAVCPAVTLTGHLVLSYLGTRSGAAALATALLAINVAMAGLYLLRSDSGFARKATGWVLLAYAPVYVVSIFLDLAYDDSQLSSVLILVSDFVLNNAFVVGLFAMMEERARIALKQLAVTDQLTGALNRAGLLGKFPDGKVSDARTLLLADLDHFKTINDTFGHSGGDTALKAFVSRAKEFLNKGEFIARIGGEEFGIVLAATSLQDAADRAEQIRQELANAPVIWNGQSMPVTASFGVAVGERSESFEAVMTRADDALYRAKRGGRNQVVA